MIDAIREYISACPIFEGNKINVNYLGNKTASYSVETVPSSPVVKTYTDGGQLRQILFVIASRELYTASTEKNSEVVKFYEDFSSWLYEKNKAGEFPALPGKLFPQSIEVLTEQYLYDVSNNDARYQIQCRLTYYKDF
jgi:hypothetical protein